MHMSPFMVYLRTFMLLLVLTNLSLPASIIQNKIVSLKKRCLGFLIVQRGRSQSVILHGTNFKQHLQISIAEHRQAFGLSFVSSWQVVLCLCRCLEVLLSLLI